MTRNRIKQLCDLVMTANDIFLTEDLKHNIRMEISREYVEIFILKRDEENEKNNACHLYYGEIGPGVPHLGNFDYNLNHAEHMIRELTQEVISNITSIGG